MIKAPTVLLACSAIVGTICIIVMQSNSKEIVLTADNIIDSMDDKNSESTLFLENPYLIVKKQKRKLELYDGEKLIKTYNIGLGFIPIGDKEREGDGKTPEGEFYIFTKNAKSRFYLSLGVSYPSIDDAERGFREKIISKKERDMIVKAINEKKTPLQNTKLGGEIYIHGGGAINDWTQGCIALANQDIKEIFDILPVGVKVKIEP